MTPFDRLASEAVTLPRLMRQDPGRFRARDGLKSRGGLSLGSVRNGTPGRVHPGPLASKQSVSGGWETPA